MFFKITSPRGTRKIVSSGGAGKEESFIDVIKDAHADAVSASSVFHYKDLSINDVKKHLHANNLNVRIL